MSAQETGTVGQDDSEQLRAEIEELRAKIEQERERASRGFWGTIREAILRRSESPMLEEMETLRSQLREELEELRLENVRLQAELDHSQQSQAALEAAGQRGFFRRLFGPRLRDTWDEDEMERARERIRGWIALILITALLVVMGLSFWYILRMSRDLDAVTADDLITVIQMVGTTLLTPLVGLIGAVTGFYYGGQTAVQAASQGAQAATQAATEASEAGRATQRAAAQAIQVTEAVRATDAAQAAQTTQAREAASRAATEAQQVGARSRTPGIVPKR